LHQCRERLTRRHCDRESPSPVRIRDDLRIESRASDVSDGCHLFGALPGFDSAEDVERDTQKRSPGLRQAIGGHRQSGGFLDCLVDRRRGI
jgi:hypothetical protein